MPHDTKVCDTLGPNSVHRVNVCVTQWWKGLAANCFNVWQCSYVAELLKVSSLSVF